ncbi:MAG: helix-turn-helix domain-containing protein [Vagococcus sp.]|uniref:helix-turn-helix domain-containing protein n=1 Tax=Vagococcus sp. TaxID=1933889 RepID=UPI002FCAAA79
MGTYQALSVNLLEVNSSFSKKNERHSFSIFYVIKGKFFCQKTGEVFELSEQEFIINNRHENITFKQNAKQNALLHLEFYFSEVEKLIGEDWRPFFSDDRLVYINEEDKQVLTEKIFRLVLDASSYGTKGQPFTSMNYLFSFLEQLNKIVLIEQQTETKDLFLVSEHPKVTAVIEYVEEFYNRRISLQEVAKKEFLSEAYLSRLFKEETGINFSEYVDSIRMKHAVEELRSSYLPILTIALNSGFSTGKRFSKLFKEKYQMTPNEYRKKAFNDKKSHSSLSTKKDDYKVIPEDEMIQIIAQFMLNEDIKNNPDELPTQYHLNVKESQTQLLIKPEKIINIGQADHGISEDVRYQIRLLQEKISFEYIRFFGLCDEVDQSHYIIKDKHVNNHRLFSFMNEMRLKPIIVLEIKEKMTFKEWQKELRYLRKVIQGYVHFEASFKSGWFLEIKLPKDCDVASYISYYDYAYDFLYNNFTTGQIGLTVAHHDLSGFKKLYESHQFNRNYPNFISFNYHDDIVKTKRHESEHLEFIEGLDSLINWLKQQENVDVPKILVTEWNIIASHTHVLSGTFFRSGIVMKSLIQMSSRVQGVGFWLNLESEGCVKENRQESSLSIFLHGPLRRPLFFVLTLFERVGDEIIKETDNYILTKRFNSYYLLFYNYYYLNPADTAYNNLWKTSQREAVFNFSQLKKGTYFIKQFLLDSNHGGIYNQWLKAGGTIEMDTDVQEYLLQSVVPDFQMKQLEIADGQLEEHIFLEINACYLLILNRIAESE